MNHSINEWNIRHAMFCKNKAFKRNENHKKKYSNFPNKPLLTTNKCRYVYMFTKHRLHYKCVICSSTSKWYIYSQVQLTVTVFLFVGAWERPPDAFIIAKIKGYSKLSVLFGLSIVWSESAPEPESDSSLFAHIVH